MVHIKLQYSTAMVVVYRKRLRRSTWPNIARCNMISRKVKKELTRPRTPWRNFAPKAAVHRWPRLVRRLFPRHGHRLPHLPPPRSVSDDNQPTKYLYTVKEKYRRKGKDFASISLELVFPLAALSALSGVLLKDKWYSVEWRFQQMFMP